jgi:group I intron endonuclease
MRNYSGIYMIENIVDRKRYIGSSVNLMHRKVTHFKTLSMGIHRNSHLQRAFAKYGGSSFSFHVLMLCEPSELLHYEQALLDRLHPEYNIYEVAGSPLGMKFSDETKKKMSETRKGKTKGPMSEEGRRNIGEAHKGQKPSEENKRKRLEAIIGQPRSEETRQKIREANTGRHPSEETRRKMSESHKGKKTSEANKRALVAARKGIPLTEEHKLHISQALTGKPHKGGMLGKHFSEESKRKMSESAKRRWHKESD